MNARSVFVFLVSIIAFGLAARAEARTGTKQELEELLRGVPPALHKSDWYGTVMSGDAKSRCGYGIKNADGKTMSEGLSLYIGDINNDGEDEYTLVSRCGGSAAVDGIIEAFRKNGKSYTPLGFDQLLAKNDLDGSKLPMNIREPLVIKKEGKSVIQFAGEDWIWEKDRIEKFKPNGCKEAESVVQQLIDLDFAGETLYQNPTFDALIDLAGRDTPGSDGFELTKSAKIESCDKKEKSAGVKVKYETYGVIAGDVHASDILKLTSKPTHFTTGTYQLVQKPSGWKIDSATVEQPHVSVDAARKRVK